jgi:hypothetical protein
MFTFGVFVFGVYPQMPFDKLRVYKTQMNADKKKKGGGVA